MNGPITAALAAERRGDLQRAAGCCTALIEHRRTMAAVRARRRFGLRALLRSEPPLVCCA